MSRRHVVIRVNADKRVILVKGWKAGDLCREAGMKPMWSAIAKGHVLDDKHLADVVALCEWQGIGVRVLDEREAV